MPIFRWPRHWRTAAKVDVEWVDTEFLTKDNVEEKLGDADGIIVPGGFGTRGIEGMVQAAQYARENNVPYFGICLGMQIAAIEFARNVLGYKDANSSEFDPESKHHVIDLMPDQYDDVMSKWAARCAWAPIPAR